MRKLREPRSVRKRTGGAAAPSAVQPHVPARKHASPMLIGTAGAVALLFVVTVGVIMYSQYKAENISDALPAQLVQGLRAEADFNPHTGVTYVKVEEGRDRNTAVSNLGSTIPVISRLNFRDFTAANYNIIGAAPWALTSNISSNMEDPDLVRYLLGNNDLIQAFLARPDVAPLVTDPQALYEFVKDEQAMKEFFDGETFQAVLADEKMVQAIAGSRLMSYLLISNSVKYFRDRPAQAAQIIRQNPYLNELRQNAFIRRAVERNRYLQKIAPILLK